MRIAGIDPGSNGAVVIIDTESTTAYYCRLKYLTGLLDVRVLQMFLAETKPNLFVVEKVRGRGSSDKTSSGWSATSNFNFGFQFGQLIQFLRSTRIPMIQVSPQTWQRTIHRKDPTTGPKDRTLEAYGRIYDHRPIPQRIDCRPNSGVLDALMIATWWIVDTWGWDAVRPWTFGVEK